MLYLRVVVSTATERLSVECSPKVATQMTRDHARLTPDVEIQLLHTIARRVTSHAKASSSKSMGTVSTASAK